MRHYIRLKTQCDCTRIFEVHQRPYPRFIVPLKPSMSLSWAEREEQSELLRYGHPNRREREFEMRRTAELSDGYLYEFEEVSNE